jgi:hypothetical protein
VGIFTVSNKRIVPPPLIQASFAAVPDTATAVAALRVALAVGPSFFFVLDDGLLIILSRTLEVLLFRG